MDNNQLRRTWKSFLVKRGKRSRQKLIEHYFEYVQKISTNLSKKFNYKMSAEELASYGLVGLYRAIDHYDNKRKVKFETYSYSRIKGAMIDGVRTEDWVPRSVRIRQTIIERAQEKKQCVQGYKISETNVLKDVGISESDFHKKHNKYKASSVVSLEHTVFPDTNDDENKKDFNKYLVADNEDRPYGGLIRKEFLSKLMGKNFSAIERKVIYHHYYEGLTMKEIAHKFDISESRMSQIHRTILKRLKSQITKNPKYFSEDILSIISECNGKESLF